MLYYVFINPASFCIYIYIMNIEEKELDMNFNNEVRKTSTICKIYQNVLIYF